MISKENNQWVTTLKNFLEQKPFKYVVIDNFLDDSICNSLVEDFLTPVPAT